LRQRLEPGLVAESREGLKIVPGKQLRNGPPLNNGLHHSLPHGLNSCRIKLVAFQAAPLPIGIPCAGRCVTEPDDRPIPSGDVPCQGPISLHPCCQVNNGRRADRRALRDLPLHPLQHVAGRQIFFPVRLVGCRLFDQMGIGCPAAEFHMRYRREFQLLPRELEGETDCFNFHRFLADFRDRITGHLTRFEFKASSGAEGHAVFGILQDPACCDGLRHFKHRCSQENRLVKGGLEIIGLLARNTLYLNALPVDLPAVKAGHINARRIGAERHPIIRGDGIFLTRGRRKCQNRDIPVEVVLM